MNLSLFPKFYNQPQDWVFYQQKQAFLAPFAAGRLEYKHRNNTRAASAPKKGHIVTKPPINPPDRREEALETLKRQIAAQRARLDPKLLKLAEQAASLSQKPAAAKNEGLVPYDRDAAAETIRLFLKDHPDAKGFEKELMSLIRRDQH